MSAAHLAPACPLCHVEHAVCTGLEVVPRAEGEQLADYWRRVRREAFSGGCDRSYLLALAAARPQSETEDAIGFDGVPAHARAWFTHEVTILTGREVRLATQHGSPTQ